MFDGGERRAEVLLDSLSAAGMVEFVTPLGPSSLASSFAALLDDGVPRGRALSDWLLAPAEVAEVFADDDALESHVRRDLARASQPTEEREAQPSPLLREPFMTEAGRWESAIDLEIGVGDSLRATVFFEALGAATLPAELLADLSARVRELPRSGRIWRARSSSITPSSTTW